MKVALKLRLTILFPAKISKNNIKLNLIKAAYLFNQNNVFNNLMKKDNLSYNVFL